MKKIFAIFIFFIFTTLTFLVITNSSEYVTAQEKVAYEMPYPGILPDHPLYFLKIVRDRAIEYTTRDPLKKAQYYLLLSDKRVGMAQGLVKKGKIKPAISTLSKGEKYSLMIPGLVKQSKQQGVGASKDFVLKLSLSNKKHREIIQMLLRQLPQGELENLQQVLDLNTQIEKELKSL